MSETTGTLSTAPRPGLTGRDRCDRCGAQAFVRAVLPSGGELLFCHHHARVHAERLRAVAVALVDESGAPTAPN